MTLPRDPSPVHFPYGAPVAENKPGSFAGAGVTKGIKYLRDPRSHYAFARFLLSIFGGRTNGGCINAPSDSAVASGGNSWKWKLLDVKRLQF